MTPFGRQPVTAGLLATHALAEGPAPFRPCDKWAVLRDLTAARRSFGVSDRDLVVLAALLSCHPTAELSDNPALIVFPSNATLSARAHGMPESTLRRHIAALVHSGLILRRDSPNGKRYARRGVSGRIDRAFGFDLRPLALRAAEIAMKADEAREDLQELRCLRESVVIGLRDLTKLVFWAAEKVSEDWTDLKDTCADLQRSMRRKLDLCQLQRLGHGIRQLTARVHALIDMPSAHETTEMSGTDRENERHHQSSSKDYLESEKRQEDKVKTPQTIPLGLVLKAAPDILDYAPQSIRTWNDLAATADLVRPMLGITPDAWQRACDVMGPDTAAVTLACMLQRHHAILRPGGYLRSLTKKAAGQGFSAGPMVMALLHCGNRQQI